MILLLSHALADTLRVPADAETITEAVDVLAGLAGDHEVLVSAGTWSGTSITLRDVEATSITIQPEVQGAVVILDDAPARMFDLLAGGRLVLRDLLLEGSGHRLAVVDDSQLELYGCEVTGFENLDYAGGAIQIRGGSTVIAEDTRFVENSSIAGGAIHTDPGNTSVVLRRSTFEGNVATSEGGAVIAEGMLVVEDCSFIGNVAGDDAGAIQIGNGAANTTFAVRRSTFVDNTAARGGAVRIRGHRGVIEDCSFIENHAIGPEDRVGGAILVQIGSGDTPPSADLTLQRSSFERNTSLGPGSAVHIRNSTTVVNASALLVCENSGGSGALAITAGPTVTLSSSLFYANASGGVQSNTSSVFQDSTFVANERFGGSAIDEDAPDLAFQRNLVVDHPEASVEGFVRFGNVYFGNTQHARGGLGTGEVIGDPGFSHPPACSFEAFQPACDGAAADGTSTVAGAAPCLADADADGWLEDVDCDDTDPDVFPGAPERCNQMDDDCDGSIDEDPTPAQQWWADVDGDGFGTGSPEATCPPPGAARIDGDCDDDDPRVFPNDDGVCTVSSALALSCATRTFDPRRVHGWLSLVSRRSAE